MLREAEARDLAVFIELLASSEVHTYLEGAADRAPHHAEPVRRRASQPVVPGPRAARAGRRAGLTGFRPPA
jgi:hypothetical protein